MDTETRTTEVSETCAAIRLLLFSIALLIPAAPAAAAVPHVVQPGETLWSIAAANNLTTRTVAAFNGLSEDAQVVLGIDDPGPDDGRGLRRPAAAGARAGLTGRGSARRRAGRSAGFRGVPPRPRAPTPCAPVTRCPASPRSPASR